ncbi:MAG TPA: hypothetical protein VFN74_11625 [Chloroflexota bacterium]|nr:hypothetical protein [Chloroflexota bacterium]
MAATTLTAHDHALDVVADTQADEAYADIAYGQIVVITARWVLIAAGIVLALWSPGNATELRIQIAVLLSLAVANFYLHAQLLTRKPVVDLVAYGTSAADIVIISTLIANQGGFASSLYVFYFPAVLAFSVSFSTWMTFCFATSAIGLYLIISLNSLGLGMADQGVAQDIATRLAMLAAVAFCGNAYWRIERTRRHSARAAQRALERQLAVGTTATVSLETMRTPEHEAAEDLFFGQIVTIWARWFLVATAVVLILWSSGTVEEISARVPIAIVLMAVNFFLHGRYLMSQPASRPLVLLSCLVDVALITAAVLMLRSGLPSQYFVFYYPVLAAVAFVFPPRVAFFLMAIALVAYAAACLVTGWSDIAASVLEQKLLATRLITVGAVGVLATYYWRIQRDRRREALGVETNPLGSARAVRQGLEGAALTGPAV